MAFNPIARDVSFSQANSVIQPVDNTGFLGAAKTIGDMFGASKQAEADAAATSVDNLAAQTAVEFALSEEQLAAENAASMEAALASGDIAKIEEARNQGRISQMQYRSQRSTILKTRALAAQEMGMTSTFVGALKKYGVNLTSLGEDYKATSQANDEIDKVADKAAQFLSDAGYVPTGNIEVDVPRLMEYQGRQSTAVAAAKDVAIQRDQATLYANQHGPTVMSNVVVLGQGILRQLQDPKRTPEENQLQLETVKLTYGSFANYVLATQSAEDAQNLIKADQASEGRLSRQYEQVYNSVITAADEIVKKGSLTTATANKLNAMKNGAGVRAINMLNEIAGPEWTDAFIGLDLKQDAATMSQLNSVMSKLTTGNLISNAEDFKTAAALGTAFVTDERGDKEAKKTYLNTYIKSLRVSLESTDPKVRASTLSVTSNEILESLQDGPEKQKLLRDIDSLIADTFSSANQALGVEDASELVDIQVTKGGAIVFVPRKGAKGADQAAVMLSKNAGTTILSNAIRAKAALEGTSIEAAVEKLKQDERVPFMLKPVETTKGAPELLKAPQGLDLTGLSEADRLDIESYILELRAKGKRTEAVA